MARCGRHEKPQAGNPHGLTINQHVFPTASIARFVIPGHGSITPHGSARVETDLAYLDDLTAGRESMDARIANPDMAAVHAANQALASP